MHSPLYGKRILFFAPVFFGYDQKIRDKFYELGADIDLFDERSVIKAYQRALLKIAPSVFNKITEKYYFKILDDIKCKRYDYVLFVKCDMPTERILKKYRNALKNSKFCLYMWDSIKNIPNIEKKFAYFDYISSFDRNDCMSHSQLNFRPLFYGDEYKMLSKKHDSYKYDLCFIGTVHSDRYKVLKVIRQCAKEKGLSVFMYLYLQSHFIYYFYKTIKSEFRDTKITDFKFGKLPSKEIAKIINESKIVIDIQHPQQTGLTMRTVEMIGMNKKLITTNNDIINYDFYDPDNIIVIDRDNVNIDANWSSNYNELSDVIYEKYSLNRWVYEVLGLAE